MSSIHERAKFIGKDLYFTIKDLSKLQIVSWTGAEER